MFYQNLNRWQIKSLNMNCSRLDVSRSSQHFLSDLSRNWNTSLGDQSSQKSAHSSQLVDSDGTKFYDCAIALTMKIVLPALVGIGQDCVRGRQVLKLFGCLSVT